MNELIAYFESLEARISALENKTAELESKLSELSNRQPEVIEKVVEKVVEVPVEVPAPAENLEPLDKPAEPAEEETPTPAPSAPLGAVEDLSHAISLGDRFLFTRELFGNRGEELQKVVSTLNALSSLDEAVAWCDAHYTWNKDSKAYELFLSALKRRFA